MTIWVKAKTATVTTIVINFRGIGFRKRLVWMLKSMPAPWLRVRTTRREFRDWSRRDDFTFWRKVAFVADHFVLWYLYCLIAAFRGHARGFSWPVGEKEGTDDEG